MRKLSSFVDRFVSMAEPRIPADRMTRLSQSYRRRLDDVIDDAFQRACMNGDLDIAADLLHILEKLHNRRVERFGKVRPINDSTIVQARSNLERHLRSSTGPLTR